MTFTAFILLGIAFIVGSLPLSVWLGKAVTGVDIRRFGDGNPGAANVWRSAGPRWGFVAVLLDFLKGAIPVAVANYLFGLEELALVLVAVAPIAGHAFSPFLGFRGGKALAVTFGIWAGLTLYLVPLILGGLFALSLGLLKPEGWAVAVGLLALLLILIVIDQPSLLGVWLGMAVILSWKHRSDLKRAPRLRFSQRGD